MTAKIQPCLWFNMNAEEAANFYVATFPDTCIDAIHHAPGDSPAGKQGNAAADRYRAGGSIGVMHDVRGDRLAKPLAGALGLARIRCSRRRP